MHSKIGMRVATRKNSMLTSKIHFRTPSSRYYNDSRKRSRDDLSYDRTLDGPSGRDVRRDWEVKRGKREPDSYSTERMTAEPMERRYGYQGAFD